MKGFFFCGLLLSPAVMFSQTAQDTIREGRLETVNFLKKVPVSKEVVSVKRDLDYKNLGQDLPVLLKNQTAVVSTSDAGNGVGYTGFRIRGVGTTSINVMMNGVPYNDSESQGTFFVDVPDLASSASQIIIQRGVGTSSNGVSAFGASVNILSKDPAETANARLDAAYGSFNTRKYTAEVNSGKFGNGHFSVLGRISKIDSDGYKDRAFSDLFSYNFTGLYQNAATRLRFMAFGGKEKTYQAWNGIDKATWETNPRFNYGGAIYDKDGNISGYYDNETDNYRQNHYQLLWGQRFSDRWNLETTLHYTRGKGYYENYKQNAEFSKYNLPNLNGQTRTDFIRKKWLDNDFYGIVSTLSGKMDVMEVNVGVVANQYLGRHFGNVTGVTLPGIHEHEYYRNESVKNEMAGFAKAIVKLDRVEFFGDLQLRNIDYSTKILQEGDGEGGFIDKNWTFFNPKAGINYRVGAAKLYFSYANAKREPNRDDLLANPDIQPETLHDFELGVEHQFGDRLTLSANGYYMNYRNQLVLTGAINDVGAFIRANSGKSYRAGFEASALGKIANDWIVTANIALSQNRNMAYRQETTNGIKDLGDTPISFSPDVVGNLGLRYQPAEHFAIGFSNNYVGSQYLDNTGNEELKLPAYFLTDLHAQYSLKMKHIGMDAKVLVNNIFNKKYVNNGFAYDSAPYYYAQAGINYMAGITLTFY